MAKKYLGARTCANQVAANLKGPTATQYTTTVRSGSSSLPEAFNLPSHLDFPTPEKRLLTPFKGRDRLTVTYRAIYAERRCVNAIQVALEIALVVGPTVVPLAVSKVKLSRR